MAILGNTPGHLSRIPERISKGVAYGIPGEISEEFLGAITGETDGKVLGEIY